MKKNSAEYKYQDKIEPFTQSCSESKKHHCSSNLKYCKGIPNEAFNQTVGFFSHSDYFSNIEILRLALD